MMITHLNLIPPERRQKLNRLVKLLLVKNILELLLVGMAVVSIILLWGWLFLIDQFNSLAQSSMTIGREYASYNTDIRQVNKITKSINDAAAGYYPITNKILEFISSTPRAIKITSLDINRQNNRIIISGTALTRADLLAYQEILRQLSWLEPSSVPTESLLTKTDINFEYQTKLKNWPTLRLTPSR